MEDAFGRKIEYLRVSLTDKCNFRCRYCMPEEGIRHLLHADILSLEEIQRIVVIMTDMGIKKVRLTGGEPLVRRGVTELVKMMPCEVYMTTNGYMLAEMIKPLREAGLCGINISLDTLDEDTFARLTGSDGLEKVLGGIDAALDSGMEVKLNCVPVSGINDKELEELVAFAGDKKVDIRFIELMPIGCATGYKGISSDDILARFEKSFGKASCVSGENAPGHGPAVYYGFEHLKGRVGFISPLSHRFCSGCNRIRLTAEGFLKLCLQYPLGTDLRSAIRGGASDEDLKHIIEEAIKQKPGSHSFDDPGRADTRKMIQIGG